MVHGYSVKYVLIPSLPTEWAVRMGHSNNITQEQAGGAATHLDLKEDPLASNCLITFILNIFYSVESTNESTNRRDT